MIALVLFLVMLIAGSAEAATRIASPSGSGSTCSLASPCSLTTGLSLLQAGDTLQLRGGTYSTTINWINKSGGSWSTPIIVEAYPLEVPIIQAPGTNSIRLGNIRFAIIRGLTIDGTNGSNSLLADGYTTQAVSGALRLLDIAAEDGNLPSDLIIENNTFSNSAYAAGAINNPNVVRVTFRGNTIYNIGKVSNCPTFYIGGREITFENNVFSDMACPAINLYNETANTVHDVVIRNNRIERAGIFWAPTSQNGTLESGGPRITQGTINTRSPALYISSGNNQQAYNNVITSSPGGIQIDHNATNCLLYHNTIYGNNSATSSQGFDSNYNAGIGLSTSASGCTVRNNIVYQPGVTNPPPVSNNGPSNTINTNICSSGLAGVCSLIGDPKFVDQNNGDFRLHTTSPVKDSGANLAGFVSLDILGNTRDTTPSLGAYEFVLEAPPEPQGNIAWWKFDENTGVSAADSTGQGHTLTAQGNATWVAPGAIGPSATRLDGFGDWWQTPLTVVMKPTSTFAITGWIKPACSAAEIFSAGDSYGAETTDTGNLFCYYYDGVNFPGVTSSGANMCDGGWHHIGCVKTSTAMLAYVDGLLRGSTQMTGAINYTLGTNALVGRSFTGPSVFDYEGDIDHLRVYDGEISQQAYLNDYNEQVPTVTVTSRHMAWIDPGSGSILALIDAAREHRISEPLAVRASIANSGAIITEFFPLAVCNVSDCESDSDWKEVTATANTVGVYMEADPVIQMGDNTLQLLPCDAFNYNVGRYVTPPIDETDKTTVGPGVVTEWEYRRLRFTSPLVPTSQVKFRVLRQNRAPLDSYLSTPILTLTAPPESLANQGVYNLGVAN